MTTVFVYEWTCAAPAGSVDPAGAASLNREGVAMLAALLADFAAVPGVSVRTLLHPGAELAVPSGVGTIRTTDEEPAFRELARTSDVTLAVAPEFDGLLEARCRWVCEEHGCWLGPTIDAIRLCADKLELGRRLLVSGVPTPEARTLGPHPWSDWVVKPRYGAGSQDTFHNAARAESALGEMIVQPFVPGLPASVAFLIGDRAMVPLPPAEQILSADGRFRYLGGRTPLDPGLARRATELGRLAVAAVPGLRGYVGVDLVLGERDWVIEINPRLTTSYVGLRRLSTTNLAEVMLRVCRGEAIGELMWRNRCVEW